MNHQVYVIIARNDVRDIIQYLIIAHAKEELGRTENSIIGKYNKIDGKKEKRSACEAKSCIGCSVFNSIKGYRPPLIT
jgi:hypothetical protein